MLHIAGEVLPQRTDDLVDDFLSIRHLPGDWSCLRAEDMAILVTGGAGFIGSNFIHRWLAASSEMVVNVDKLTYAGNLNNLAAFEHDPRHVFVHGSINDRVQIFSLLRQYEIRAIINFAAESHVDRSISGPEPFIETNVLGTMRLLEAAREYHQSLSTSAKELFRFVHVSTDEVYGSLAAGDPAFLETSNYFPNSPYSASKAASDHLVRAYRETYDFPAITTHCSNNYGPFHFPEKLIPLVVINALALKPLPIYGDGKQIRDWLYVDDHCSALRTVLEKGKIGDSYNVGGNNEKTNLEVVTAICLLLDELRPRVDGRRYAELIAFVGDRPGHDRRYAINAGKIRRDLGWVPLETFDTGLRKTVKWYLENQSWVESVKNIPVLNEWRPSTDENSTPRVDGTSRA